MARRTAITMAAVTATLAALAALTLAPSATAERDGRPGVGRGDARAEGLAVTGYAEEGTAARVIDREAHALTTLGVDGVNLEPSGAAIAAPSREARRLLRRGHADGTRAELLVGNFDGDLGDFSPQLGSRLLRHPRHLRAVAAQAARLVRRQGWDGVTVDLEALRRGDGDGLATFVDLLQRRMPPARTVSICLTAARSAAGYRAQGYELRRLGRLADVVVLMGYDEHGPTWSGPGPVGALGWQRHTLRALTARVPRAKVDLGVAGYGYSWPTGHDGRQYTDRAAREAVASDGAAAHWRPAAGEWTATLHDGTVLWWSDARSWRLRVRLAEHRGLHGLALWRLGAADPLPH